MRSRVRDDGGIRWWEKENFTAKTCWRGSRVQEVQWYLLTIFKSSKWSEPRTSKTPGRGGLEYLGEEGKSTWERGHQKHLGSIVQGAGKGYGKGRDVL